MRHQDVSPQTDTLFMLSVLSYMKMKILGVRRLAYRIWRSRLKYEAPRLLSSNGHAGRLVTTEQPWAESMKAYPG